MASPSVWIKNVNPGLMHKFFWDINYRFGNDVDQQLLNPDPAFNWREAHSIRATFLNNENPFQWMNQNYFNESLPSNLEMEFNNMVANAKTIFPDLYKVPPPKFAGHVIALSSDIVIPVPNEEVLIL